MNIKFSGRVVDLVISCMLNSLLKGTVSLDNQPDS